MEEGVRQRETHRVYFGVIKFRLTERLKSEIKLELGEKDIQGARISASHNFTRQMGDGP